MTQETRLSLTINTISNHILEEQIDNTFDIIADLESIRQSAEPTDYFDATRIAAEKDVLSHLNSLQTLLQEKRARYIEHSHRNNAHRSSHFVES